MSYGVLACRVTFFLPCLLLFFFSLFCPSVYSHAVKCAVKAGLRTYAQGVKSLKLWFYLALSTGSMLYRPQRPLLTVEVIVCRQSNIFFTLLVVFFQVTPSVDSHIWECAPLNLYLYRPLGPFFSAPLWAEREFLKLEKGFS